MYNAEQRYNNYCKIAGFRVISKHCPTRRLKKFSGTCIRKKFSPRLRYILKKNEFIEYHLPLPLSSVFQRWEFIKERF